MSHQNTYSALLRHSLWKTKI